MADDLLALLRAVPGVEQALVGGSLRRGCETVGDIDLLVAARPDSPVMTRFLAVPRCPSGCSRGRRGWLEAADVLNSRGLDRLLALLKPTMR